MYVRFWNVHQVRGLARLVECVFDHGPRHRTVNVRISTCISSTQVGVPKKALLKCQCPQCVYQRPMHMSNLDGTSGAKLCQ